MYRQLINRIVGFVLIFSIIILLVPKLFIRDQLPHKVHNKIYNVESGESTTSTVVLQTEFYVNFQDAQARLVALKKQKLDAKIVASNNLYKIVISNIENLKKAREIQEYNKKHNINLEITTQ